MVERELTVDAGDVRLPATLTLPDNVRAGVVTMHPAISSDRQYFLLAHVAEMLTPRGIAVLRYDRRPADGMDDVAFSAQAADALHAIALLREHVGPVPIGLWAYSQGTWGATLAAEEAPDDVAFLALIASPAVSPAEQMRYGTAEQLRRNGYGPEALEELSEVRGAIERFLRHEVEHDDAQAIVSRYAGREWFPLTYYPSELPTDASWHDMDFDPSIPIRRVRCPVLLVYGADDEWTPVEPSIHGWRNAAGPIDIDVLSGLGHAPVLDDTPGAERIDPRYTERLTTWLDGVLS